MRAYYDEIDTIIVNVERSYFGGEVPKFYLEDAVGKNLDCKVVQIENNDNEVIYTLKITETLIIGNEYFIVSQQGLRTQVVYRYIVQSKYFEDNYVCEDVELGVIVNYDETIFRLWAPTASKVLIEIEDEFETVIKEMNRTNKGVYEYQVNKSLIGATYVYYVEVNGETVKTIDPYGKSSTANGVRSAIIDVEALKKRRSEPITKIKSYCDAIIYETSVRDITSSNDTGSKLHSTFSALVEENTECNGLPTGFNYICDLGITHVQLLPVLDFYTVDEYHPERQYNWGYDPYQYFTLEGSYASNPNEIGAREHEFINMINKFHSRDISVNLDVVFNHHYSVGLSSFNKVVPYYYFRLNENRTLSNGSYCGNDFDSTKVMFRKFIIDVCKYYVEVFGIDGFRFDLMSIIDIETMNILENKLRTINPSIMLYGEGWNMPTALADEYKTTIQNNYKTPQIGYFNDYFRDHTKGSTSEYEMASKGYLTGDSILLEANKYCLAGMAHPDLFHIFSSPTQSINYVECHDNATLWDKLKVSNQEEVREIRVERVKLINAFVMLGQGVPFFQSGQEFCRSKNGFHNTYNMPDSINQISWARKNRHLDVVKHFKDCIALRKSCPGLRLSTQKELHDKVSFDQIGNDILIYNIKDTEVNGNKCDLQIFINPSLNDVSIKPVRKSICLLDKDGACNVEVSVVNISKLSMVVIAQC